MSGLLRRAPAVVPLTERLAALREALAAADDAPGVAVEPVRALLAKAGARTALGDATVVALAGATGSGKSTLFNAVAGSELSAPGVRRPTTGAAHACVWPTDTDAGATGLLDWLGVPRRHIHTEPDPALAGLVLLDLPDHDSTRLEHRLEVDRLVELVDVLVWVLDPQKYADGAVHERYLAPYAGHADVLLVLLNQADRLGEPERRACLADLRGLLDREGLARVPLLAVSGRTGLGLPELHEELAGRVAARRAASERLTADVRAVAARALQGCAPPGEDSRGGGRSGREAGLPGTGERRELVDALAEVAGVPQVTSAVEKSVRRRGAAATGWPPLRVRRGLRPDPLRRLHLGGPAGSRGRTSLPPAGGASQARLAQVVRRAREASSHGLPEAWRDGLRETARQREADLPAHLDRAVAGTELDADVSPRWWGATAAVQGLLLAVALVGIGWLLLLVALGVLQLDVVVPLPRTAGIPVPTLLMFAGLLAGALVAVLARPFVRVGASRRARKADRRLRERVGQVADDELLGPLAAQRASYDRWCAALRRAAR